jgi:TP901 family phage tail tape measure protein
MNMPAQSKTNDPFEGIKRSIELTRSEAERLYNEMATKLGKTLGVDIPHASQVASGDLATFAGRVLDANVAVKELDPSIELLNRQFALQNLHQAFDKLTEFSKALFELLGEGVAKSMDFEEAMLNVKHALMINKDVAVDWSDTARSGDQLAAVLDMLAKKSTEVALQTKFNESDMASLVAYLAQNGIDSETMLDGAIQAVANLAQATNEDWKPAAQVMTGVIHAMGDELSTMFDGDMNKAMERVTDTITNLSQTTGAELHTMGDTFKYVLPIASEFGQSFEDASVWIDILYRSGIRGSQAGTALRRMFTSLLAPTDEAADAIAKLSQKMGMGSNMFVDAQGNLKSMTEIQRLLYESTNDLSDAEQAQTMHAIFGQYAMQSLMKIAGESPEKFKALSEAINATGTAQAKANDWLKTGAGEWQVFTENVDNAKKQLGDGLLPMIKDALTNILSPLSEWFGNLDPRVKQAIAVALAFTAAIAGLVGVIGAAVTSFALMQIGLAIAGTSLGALVAAAAPVVAIIAAIVAAGVLLYEAYQTNFGGLRDVMNAIWGEIVATFGGAYESIKAWLEDIAPIAEKAWANVKPALEAFIRFLVDILGPAVEGAWNIIKGIFSATFEFIGGLVKTFLAVMAGDWDAAWEGIKTMVKANWDVLVLIFREAWKALVDSLNLDLIMQGLDVIYTQMKAWFEALPAKFREWALNAMSMFADGLLSGRGLLGSALDSIGNAITSKLGFHSPTKEGPASDSDTWMPNMIDMFVDGINANRSRLQAAVNGLALDMNVGMTGGVAAPSLTPRVGGGGSRPINVYVTYQGGRGDDIEKLAQAVGRAVSVVQA